jgi:hypothetical protein
MFSIESRTQHEQLPGKHLRKQTKKTLKNHFNIN